MNTLTSEERKKLLASRINLGTAVISKKDGREFIYLKRVNPNEDRVVDATAFKSACLKLQKEASENPLNVKGSPLAYVGKNDAFTIKRKEIVTKDIYDQALSTPENKPRITELKRLEAKKGKLFTEITTIDKEIKSLNTELFKSVKM